MTLSRMRWRTELAGTPGRGAYTNLAAGLIDKEIRQVDEFKQISSCGFARNEEWTAVSATSIWRRA